MKLLGTPILSSHLLGLHDDKAAEMLRAWMCEIRHCAWANELELIAAFPSVDLSNVPAVIFVLASAAIRIETLIDFRLGIVLLTHISEVKVATPESQRPERGV
jgi:mRNA-degrading endonuclease HigB of HigAB toxin-antitoxin module